MEPLRRDRPTWLIYSLFGVLGYFLYGFTPAVTLLRDDQGTSSLVAGLHSTCYAAGAVVIGLCGHLIVARYGRASSVWLGLVGLCMGTVGLCTPGPPALTLPAAFVASVGFSLLINVSSVVLADRHGASSASAMNESNAIAAGTGLLAPVVLGVALSSGLGWRLGPLLTVVLAAVVTLTFLRVTIPESREYHRATASSSVTLSRAFWWAWLAMATAVSIEFCMTIWASDVLRERIGASDGVAASSVTAVVAGLMIGRVITARLALRHRTDVLLQVFLGVVLAGFLVFWLSQYLWLSFVGLLICGLGIGPMFPLTFSALIATSQDRPDLAAARSSLAVGLAVGSGPLLIGVLTDVSGPHRAMVTVPVLVVLSVLAVRHSATLARREQAARAGNSVLSEP